MPEGQYILAIDRGTTSTKALVLDNEGHIVGISRGHFGVDGIYPRPGWVEYSPSEMWQPILEGGCRLSRPGWFAAGKFTGGANCAKWCHRQGLQVARSVQRYLKDEGL